MDTRLIAAFVVLAGLIAIAPYIPAADTTFSHISSNKTALKQFTSDAAFRAYVQNHQGTTYNGGIITMDGATMKSTTSGPMTSGAASTASGSTDTGASTTPSRFSETNVQVKGIDEPDIVKTDGTTLYYSRQYWQGNTSLFNAWPPKNLSQISSVKENGELLLHNNLLLVLTNDWQNRKITAYNVSDPANPKKKWSADLNGSIEATRLHNGQLYLVLQQQIDYNNPCPVHPLTVAGSTVLIPCTKIYYPPNSAYTDVTYTVLDMNPDTGSVTDQLTFVGDSRQSVVSMSNNALYITHTAQQDAADLYLSFFAANGGSLLDKKARSRLAQLSTYNISQDAKMVEIQHILADYRQRLTPDDRKTFDSRFRNAIGNYTQTHLREFQHTTITKIGTNDGLTLEHSGAVPGVPLNQFALDEYNGNLRVATTVEPVSGYGQSENDVYVLNPSMQIIGSVKGMGLNERVYTVRFIKDTGYVVTYQQTDPFHVLDLSNPAHPQLVGELKMPGFSSYLHPLTNNTILGVGRDNGNVKVATFDVSNPGQPTQTDSYTLDAYWSDVQNNHHAFLQDAKHQVFFIPTNNGGYVFSYNNGITLKKAVDMQQVDRAVFIGDYLYLVGQNEIVVLDETNWERVKTLKLSSQIYPRPVPLPEPMVQ